MTFSRGPASSLLFLLTSSTVLPGQVVPSDPREIVRKSVEIDQRSWRKLADYTFLETVLVRRLDGKGQITKQESNTWDVLLLEGAQYRRKVARDGQPLPPKEAAAEDKRFERERAKRRNESEAERKKRLAAEQEDREKDRIFAREIPEAFDFELKGEELVEGEPVWVIAARPRAGFRPTAPRAGLLKNFAGTLWIEKRGYNWVRVEAEALSTVSLGWVLARLKPGTRFSARQTKVGDIWAPGRAEFTLDARLALLKGLRANVQVERSQYRRFSSDSRIISIEEIPRP